MTKGYLTMDSDHNKHLSINIELLFSKNNLLDNQFKGNSLIQFIQSEEVNNKLYRERLLDCIQVFSDYFQKVIMLRYVFCNNPKFLPLSTEHLQEEFGHNSSLLKDRNNRPPIWDPILDATASWFAWKMFTLDNEEKIVLVHLVLETSANTFFQLADKAMTKYGETTYFKTHAQADEQHGKMGQNLINNLSQERLERLLLIQQQGWDVLNTTCDRITSLIWRN